MLVALQTDPEDRCSASTHLCVIDIDFHIFGIPITMMGQGIINKLFDCLRQTYCFRPKSTLMFPAKLSRCFQSRVALDSEALLDGFGVINLLRTGEQTLISRC